MIFLAEGLLDSAGFSFKTYWRMILKAYLQLGQHTFWNKSVGFTVGFMGDLEGVRGAVVLLYLKIGLFKFSFSWYFILFQNLFIKTNLTLKHIDLYFNVYFIAIM